MEDLVCLIPSVDLSNLQVFIGFSAVSFLGIILGDALVIVPNIEWCFLRDLHLFALPSHVSDGLYDRKGSLLTNLLELSFSLLMFLTLYWYGSSSFGLIFLIDLHYSSLCPFTWMNYFFDTHLSF